MNPFIDIHFALSGELAIQRHEADGQVMTFWSRGPCSVTLPGQLWAINVTPYDEARMIEEAR